MKSNTLIRSILLALLIASTVCLEAQSAGKICLTQNEMKFFIEQDARATSLAKDTLWMGQDGRTKDSIIKEQALNQQDLKDIINTQQFIAGLWEADAKMYQDSSDYWRAKYTVVNTKSKRQTKTIIKLIGLHISKDALAAFGTYLFIKP